MNANTLKLPTKITINAHICAFIVKIFSHQSINLWSMEHRGEIVKEAVYRSGYPITELAKRLSKSRRWIYLMFENANVSLDIILQIGKIIHYDFKDEIKEFNSYQKALNESAFDYQNDEANPDYWKNKYLKLLEEYNDLLKKRID
ncbi:MULTISPECIES: hypothetical protein [Flavobacterium]|uniref:hypothetical protein n=1 Tax=Flavobacterium TaxID=237 RepID=UPI0021152D11|nr:MULTISPECIES: hypothetical protein [Flavobacterium]UUF15192.1 hypothetical protein NLJ00_03595 [Flavobacterium panici]